MKSFLILFLLITGSVISQNELKHDVYFNTDEYDVPLTEENRLLLFISSLDTIAIDKISIYGFCDDRGTNDYNLELSQNRADAIKDMFSSYGIDKSLITNVNGKGEILLKVLNEDEVHKIRGLNRKVEIIVKPKDKTKETAKPEVTTTATKDKKVTTQDIANGTVKKGDKIRLENIYFKTNYSYVTSDSKKTLEELAKILVAKKNIYFTIQGHVCCTQNSRDAVDKKTQKRNLSVARAKYIYDYLARKGVDKKRMKYVGMRRKFPLGGDPKYDRRVEIVITYIAEE
ncbi:OmpA/MotB domain-containing protein [Mesoflavibacter sp. HG96]|uniref:OmpA family protein n=1 Tax=Mesoflavibacter TaxID=444051 RepID=UPI000D107D66|nr:MULTISPECIES: OmpA family protein [Mesoflavibacter]QIJ88922.1 OmpA/MotB domain-containing protein [Mesoflavibacter sp. HG96]QIJ91650.1 OmpA/MotB domain-containing protein [Mesoflavibacter sp. HG37]